MSTSGRRKLTCLIRIWVVVESVSLLDQLCRNGILWCNLHCFMSNTFLFMQRYLQHIRKHDQVMQELEEATKKYKDFEVAYKEFEVQVSLSHCQPFSRRCYLPPLPDLNPTPPWPSLTAHVFCTKRSELVSFWWTLGSPWQGRETRIPVKLVVNEQIACVKILQTAFFNFSLSSGRKCCRKAELLKHQLCNVLRW